MPQHVPPRIYRRVPFETAVRLRFDRFHGFVEQYSANLSLGGMFIRSAEVPPLGSDVNVEFRLEDGFELIRGRGRVVWRREPEDADDDAGDPPGFGLRFLELTPGSRELIFRLVERRAREGDRVFDLDDAAPATAAARLVHDEERLAAPPWDLPTPRSGEEGPARSPSGAFAAGGHGAETTLFGRATREGAARDDAGAPAALADGPKMCFGDLAAADDATDETIDSSAAVVDAPENPPTPFAAVADASKNPLTPFATPADEVEARKVAYAAAAGWPVATGVASAAAADDEEERHDAPAAALGGSAAAGGILVSGLDEEVEEARDVASASAAGTPARATFASLREEVEEHPSGAATAADEAAVDPEASFAGLAEADEEDDGGAERFAWAGAGGDVAGERALGGAAASERDDLAPRLGGESEGGAAAAWGAPLASGGVAPWPTTSADAPPADPPADQPADAPHPSPRSRRGRLLAGLAAALAVVALGAFLLFRAWAAPAPAAADAATTTNGAAAAAPAPASPTADGTPPATDAATATPLIAPSASPTASAPVPNPTPGARTIERIAFERRDDGLDFEIAGGGPIAPAQVDHFRVGGERPRLVVRIAGVERPYGRGEIAVGGGLVERVRTGFHPPAAGADAGSLHVVFDLAAAGAAATVDAASGRVRVRIEGG